MLRLMVHVGVPALFVALISAPSLAQGSGSGACDPPRWAVTTPVPIFSPVSKAQTPPFDPVIECASDGYTYVVAWAADPLTLNYDLYVRVRSPGGTWGPQVKVSNEARSTIFSAIPAIAVGPPGVVLVAWPSYAGLVSWSTDHGTTFSTPVAVTKRPAWEMEVALDSAGHTHFAWIEQGVAGKGDVFYSRTVAADGASGSAGGFHGIDPGNLAPRIWITADSYSQSELSLAVDEQEMAYVSFTGGAVKTSELVVLGNRSLQRITLPELSGFAQVDASPGGRIGVLYSQQFDASKVVPMLLPGVGGDLLLSPRAIPSTAPVAGPVYTRSIHVSDNGRVAVSVQGISNKDPETDAFIELLVSCDFGSTFSEPLMITPFEDVGGVQRAGTTSLSVDPDGNIHLIARSNYIDRDPNDGVTPIFVLYVTARYE